MMWFQSSSWFSIGYCHTGLWRHWWNSQGPIYMCHRHGIWVKEKTERFGCIYSNWGFWCWCQWMPRWTTVFPVCMHNGFPAGRSKQMIMTSWNDVTMISHAILGGNYKRRAHPNLRAVIWVFWHWRVRSIDKSKTLYSGYLSASCGAEHNQNELCVSFIHMHIPRPLWGTFSKYDFSCLILARQSLPASPWTWYQAKHGSQPFGSRLQGQDKLLVWCEGLPIHLVYLCTTCHMTRRKRKRGDKMQPCHTPAVMLKHDVVPVTILI